VVYVLRECRTQNDVFPLLGKTTFRPTLSSAPSLP
jgi:hypothetical protein